MGRNFLTVEQMKENIKRKKVNEITGYIDINPETIKRFEKAMIIAEHLGLGLFRFDGHEIDIEYGKYVLRYAKNRIKEVAGENNSNDYDRRNVLPSFFDE